MHTNPHPDEAARAASVARLQDCLRSELAAVATYELALTCAPLVEIHRTLQEILTSHARRAALLRARLDHLGADMASAPSSGSWEAFVSALDSTSRSEPPRAAITALERGEQDAVALYAAGVARCDLWTRTLLTAEFLPEQKRTHDLCWSLHRRIEAAR